MAEAATQTVAEVITLSQWLEAWLEQLSSPAGRAAAVATFGDDLVLRMGGLGRAPHKSANAWAEIVCRRDGGQPTVMASFGHGPRNGGRVDHITEVPFAALLACGELWQDSKKHRPGGQQ